MKFTGLGSLNGEQKEISLVADSPNDAFLKMKNMGYTNINVVEKNSLFSHKKVKTKDISLTFRQLASFASTGESFTKSLASVADVTENPTLKSALMDIKKKIEAGQSIPNAFANYKFFPKIVINLLRVGDSSGDMERTLDELARYLQQSYNIEQGVSSAFIYPKVIMGVMFLAMSFIVAKILPQFRAFYTDMHIEMPLVTKMLYAFSDFLNEDWFLALPAVVLLIYFVKNIYKYFPTTCDVLMIKTPVIKTIMIHLYMFRFCKTMEILSSAQLDIVESLKLTAEVMENHLYSEVIKKSIPLVQAGEGITSSIRKNDKDKIFDAITIAFLSTGEEANEIDSLMSKASDFYQKTINLEIDGFGKIIEPILLVIIAVFVLILVSSVYLPIFRMSQITNQ